MGNNSKQEIKRLIEQMQKNNKKIHPKWVEMIYILDKQIQKEQLQKNIKILDDLFNI